MQIWGSIADTPRESFIAAVHGRAAPKFEVLLETAQRYYPAAAAALRLAKFGCALSSKAIKKAEREKLLLHGEHLQNCYRLMSRLAVAARGPSASTTRACPANKL